MIESAEARPAATTGARTHTARDPLQWVRAHLVAGSAVTVSDRNRRPYPEVTGYLIPNLLQQGEVELARRFAAFLVATQRPDGAFAGPDDQRAYAFDTGQALRGLLAFPELEACREAARRAADWLCDTSAADGRLKLPEDLAAWDLGPRGRIPEAVHLYVLPALVQAADVLDEPRYRAHALRARDAYLADADALSFDNANMLSHFFGYVHEALVDLDAAHVADAAVTAALRHQRTDGALPAYHDVDWVCVPGQIQLALVLQKLGRRDEARRALAFARAHQREDGGFPGSVGPGAAYFHDDQPSWAAKFWLDALALGVPVDDEDAPDAAAPVLDRNLAPAEWHRSIRDGQQARDIAQRVQNDRPPAWLDALLEAVPADASCLELGSGTGELSAHLSRAGRDVQLLDFSPECLALSRDVFDALSLPGAFVEGDVTRALPQADDSVDVVWSSGLLEHFDADVVDHIVRESARVARRRVVALVPYARSLPYRLGKHLQEQSGEWTWGREVPFASLRAVFERAGLVDVQEWSCAPEHALEFLTAPELQPMKAQLQAFYEQLGPDERRAVDQGYLLVTVGHVAGAAAPPPPPPAARATRRLCVIPNDPLDAYPAAGYPDLTGYFNPAGAFDEVFCLSPHEPREKQMYGMQVVPTTAEELPQRIRELGVDVVRAYCLPSGQFACRDKVDGVRYVVSVHDNHPDRCPGALPDADEFLAVSGSVEQFLRDKGAAPDRIHRLPNRVDLDVFQPVDDDARKKAWQARFPGRYRVLLVGRRSEQKNLDTLIRALGQLGPDYVGVFVGRGDEQPYRELAAEAGANCHFVDAVPNHELAEWYSFADVMCTPSRWEGFGIVFIEALASGALVVTSDIAPMNEFVKDRESGLLVADYEDPDALARTLRLATEDAALATAVRGRARAAAAPFAKANVDALERSRYDLAPTVTRSKPAFVTAGRDLPGSVRLHLRSDDTREAWDRIATTSPDAWVYHRDDWQRCQLDAFEGLQDLGFLVEWEGRPVAVCPLQRHVHRPGDLFSTFMGTGGPALCADLDPEQRGEVLRVVHQLVGRFLREGMGRRALVQLPQLALSARAHWPSMANPLVAHGYRLASTQTSLVDLTASEEQLFANMKQRHRNRIRRAQKLDVEVGLLTGAAGMDAYYDLHVETYTRTGVPPHPKSYFDAIGRHMVENGHARTFGARVDGELVAAANVATHGDGSLYWTGAYSRRGLETEVGKLLQWEIVKAMKAEGRRWHETGEVFPAAKPGTKEHGLTMYKSGFGGVVRPWFKGELHLEDL